MLKWVISFEMGWGWVAVAEGASRELNALCDGLKKQDAVLISISQYHSCAVLSGGTAKCWGDNQRCTVSFLAFCRALCYLCGVIQGTVADEVLQLGIGSVNLALMATNAVGLSGIVSSIAVGWVRIV